MLTRLPPHLVLPWPLSILIFLVGLCLNCVGCLENCCRLSPFSFSLGWFHGSSCTSQQVQREDATREIWKIFHRVSEPKSPKLMSHIFKFLVQVLSTVNFPYLAHKICWVSICFASTNNRQELGEVWVSVMEISVKITFSKLMFYRSPILWVLIGVRRQGVFG